MTTYSTGSDLLGLEIANLPLWLDARGTGLHISVPECHAPFLASGPGQSGLVLQVRDAPLADTHGWRSLYYPSDTWELWLDPQDHFLFVAPGQSPPRRQVHVDPGFTTGSVVGEFADDIRTGAPLYPLQDVDIVLFSNWLAGSGDLILHAAGAELKGRGYCFAGPAGVGKSTLAAHLCETSSATVLGEDQVILRSLDGCFWIFGTPWHFNPALCSPRGVPLDGLFFLRRTGRVGVEPCTPMDGIARLLQTAFVPYYRPAAVSSILDNLARLAEQVPFYTLRYELGSSLWELIGADLPGG